MKRILITGSTDGVGRATAEGLLDARPQIVVDARTTARLAGLFDGPTSQPLDFDAPMQVLDTSRLAADDTAIALLMTCASAWMETTLASAGSGQRLVYYDEAWRMLRHLP